MLAANWSSSRDAVQYDSWAAERSLPPATRLKLLKNNRFVEHAQQRLRMLKQRGPDCFDARFYLTTNAQDLGAFLKQSDPVKLAWEHFLDYGLMEGRTHRFVC